MVTCANIFVLFLLEIVQIEQFVRSGIRTFWYPTQLLVTDIAYVKIGHIPSKKSQEIALHLRQN